jgi:hypothetical protein
MNLYSIALKLGFNAFKHFSDDSIPKIKQLSNFPLICKLELLSCNLYRDEMSVSICVFF